MNLKSVCFVFAALSATSAFAGQATSLNFYPPEKLKPFTKFLGFDRDKGGMAELETALQNSGTNWHCTSDAHRLRCPLTGATGVDGTNVSFRAPHMGDGGAMVSEFRATLLADDRSTLTQLQPASPAAALLGDDWPNVLLAVGKPTNNYDDGSRVQHLYCAASGLPTKPGEPRVVRLYLMYVNVTKATNKVTAIELATFEQALTALQDKPSC